MESCAHLHSVNATHLPTKHVLFWWSPPRLRLPKLTLVGCGILGEESFAKIVNLVLYGKIGSVFFLPGLFCLLVWTGALEDKILIQNTLLFKNGKQCFQFLRGSPASSFYSPSLIQFNYAQYRILQLRKKKQIPPFYSRFLTVWLGFSFVSINIVTLAPWELSWIPLWSWIYFISCDFF